MKTKLAIAFILSFALLSSGQQADLSKYTDQLGYAPGSGQEYIFAPGFVSTDAYNHATLTISSSCDEIYWASEDDQIGHRVIWHSTLNNGIWSAPENLNITKEFDGDCPMLSPDGKRLYFLSNRPLPADQNRKRERVWYAELGASGWMEPVALDPSINAKHLHWQVSIDKDYNIYFGSERIGSKGKDDIFFSEYKNGSYSTPVSLPETINSIYHESTPFVAPDGSYLLFVRSKYGDDSYPSGLYISFRDKKGNWQEAKYLGDHVNCSACPFVSPDGKYFFFKKDGKEFRNVYWTTADFLNLPSNK